VDNVKKLFDEGPRALGKYVWNKESVAVTSNSVRYSVSHFMISEDYPALLAELKELQSEELKKFGKQLYEKWKTVLEKLAYNVGKLDAAIATLKMTEKHGLIEPTFVEGSRAFYQAENLRHPLMESTLTNELYVPNDFEGGTEKTTGMALYGVNSCGKSSGMRSIGTAVVMAQAGFGVAATAFHLCPFRNIMCRILGGNSKDQLRLSSFAIEVSEMKPIFNRANSQTLVLGDEIAHATEISSGTCIVATLLDHLVKHKIPFVVATHMRAIPELIEDETESKTNFSHFRVDIDRAGTKVIFNRKLQQGLGPQTYGISMAEYMGLPPAVCLIAREKLAKLENQPDSLIRNRCRYNHEKLMSPVCEYRGCTKSSEEHDHSYPREISTHNSEFSHVANHAANFQALCHEHHVLKTNAEKTLKRKLGRDSYRALSPMDYKRRMLEHNVVVK
jgi:DNA mismatch repair protein MutS